MRAGIEGMMFGAKVCHEVLQPENFGDMSSGISCSESTWRKQRR